MEFEKEINYRGRSYMVMGSFTARWADQSFSHEFGIEERGRWEVDDFTVECISLLTSEGPADLDWKNLDKDLKEYITDEILQLEAR